MKISQSMIRNVILEVIAKEYSDEFYKDNPDVLDLNNPGQFHKKIVTKAEYSEDFQKAVRRWSSNEVKVLQKDLLKRSNMHKVIKELIERSGETSLAGTDYSMLDVLSPYGALQSKQYTKNLRQAISKNYIGLLRTVLSNLPKKQYAGFDEVVLQVSNLINSYGKFSMSSIANKISDFSGKAQRGIFGRVYDYFAGTEEQERLQNSRNRALEELGEAVAFYYMRHRLGETIIADYVALRTPDILDSRKAKSRFTNSQTFLVYLHNTAGKKAEEATRATAQARKDYFRRVMDKRSKEGSKGSLDNWFAVHYPYAYAKGGTIGYFKGVKDFIEDTGEMSSTGELKKSKDELATIAYPKSYKNLNDGIATGKKGFGRFPKIAVVLTGRITAIYSQDVFSSTFSDPGFGGKRSGSGFARYAGGKGTDYRRSLDQRSKFMIYDLEGYEQQILANNGFPGRSGYNEAFLDNWSVAGIACNWASLIRNAEKINIGGKKGNEIRTLNKDLKDLLEALKIRNLKIYDHNFKEFSYQTLATLFDHLVKKTAKSMGVDIPRGIEKIEQSERKVKRKEKQIYFYGMYKDKNKGSISLTSFGDKKVSVNYAIRLYKMLNKHIDSIGNPTRPKFFYGTEKKGSKINWKPFSPRKIKQAVIEEQFKKLLLDIELI